MLSAFSPKVKKWVLGRKQWQKQWTALLQKTPRKKHQPVVWMHASSLGEFEQGSPLLESIKLQWPEAYIVVSFFSPSGYEVRKQYAHAEAIGYLPFDHPTESDSFVEMIQPDLVIWVKYEYWYYTLKAVADRKIPLILVSGIFRESQPFFAWYGELHRKMLSYFTHFFVQNAESAKLIAPLVKAEKITPAGDTRFDTVLELAKNWKPIEQVANWLQGAETVIVAGSTWPSDEEKLVHFAKTNPGIKWVIAPHHVDINALEDTKLLFKQPLLFSELSHDQIQPKTLPNVLIIDNVGMLKYLYKYGTICYVGGGFTGDGIHNVLEAAVYGKPVMHGPEFSKFPEAQGLLDAGASTIINSALELEKVLPEMLATPQMISHMGEAAAHFVQQHAGASAAIIQYIQENRLLTNEKKR